MTKCWVVCAVGRAYFRHKKLKDDVKQNILLEEKNIVFETKGIIY